MRSPHMPKLPRRSVLANLVVLPFAGRTLVGSRLELIVTELVIDGRWAERGQGQYVRAMDAAKAALEKAIGTHARLIEATDRLCAATERMKLANARAVKEIGARAGNLGSAA